MSKGAVQELATRLRAFYDAAPSGRKAVSIHLFGIEHAAALKAVNKTAVAEQAGLPSSYGRELAKGISLAEYVTLTKPLA